MFHWKWCCMDDTGLPIPAPPPHSSPDTGNPRSPTLLSMWAILKFWEKVVGTTTEQLHNASSFHKALDLEVGCGVLLALKLK